MGLTTRSGKSTSNVPLRQRERAPAKSFDRFNELPKELRKMVWKAARPRRILSLTHHLGPPFITIYQSTPMISGEAWDEVRRDYTTITETINGTRRMTTDLHFCPDSDTLYVTNQPPQGVTFPWFRLLNEMAATFRTYPKVLAINHDFITPGALQVTDFLRFSDMVELHVIVGRAAHKTRTKTLVPGQPVKFGRAFRGEGAGAEFLARVVNVEALCAELVRRNTAIEAPIPVVKIMMLFDGDRDWLKPSLE